MSYILFSQTSAANGQRNNWISTTPGEITAFGNSAVVNGSLVTNVANSAFNESAVAASFGGGALSDGFEVTSSRSMFDLSGNGSGGLGAGATELQNRLAGTTGNVLGSNTGSRALDSASVLDSATKTLNIGLNDKDWNGIKNVEILIDSADTMTTYDTLIVRNFVDGRIKIGDTVGCRSAKDFLASTEMFELTVENAKRGQIEGAQSDVALKVNLQLWTNDAGWQNSFSNTGSALGDTFTITAGGIQKTAQFGNGAGSVVGGESVYDGRLTTLFTNLGAGNDTYTSTDGGALNRTLAATDWVWGGSDDDTIKTGAGNDVIFGDFGGLNGIAQLADPTALKLKIGGSQNIEDWVNGTGAIVYGTPLAADDVTLSATTYKVQDGNLADRAFFEVKQADSAQDAATWNAKSGGIGISLTTDGRAPNGTESNPEVNLAKGDKGSVSDVLGVNLGRDASGATVDLSLFYAKDGGSGKIETALVTVGNDTDGDGDLDAVVGTFVLRADGSVGAVTGALSGVIGTAAVPGGEAYASNKPGLVSGSFLSSVAFDTIEFRSAGLVNSGTYAAVDNNDVSDFFVRGICYTVAGNEGNDWIEAGTGADYVEAGGDRGQFVLCTKGSGNLLLNGGFETLADDAAQQEGSSWYLTTGASSGAGADFGWTVKPTVLTFDDIPLPDVAFAEARIANGYGGFNWKQAGVYDTSTPLGGYTASSGTQIGFIAEANNGEIGGYEDAAAGTPLTFSRATPFDLMSAKFSAAFRDDLMITATAYGPGNAVLGTKTFEVDQGGPTFIDFTTGITGTFAGAVRVEVNANDGNPGTSDYFGMDDLTFRGSNIEIQKDGTGGLAPFAGTYKMELDSHPQAAANPHVTQAVATCDGGLYQLSFAFAERQGAGDGSSDFQLFWDGALVATFTNPSGSDTWTVVDANGSDGITVAIADVGPAGGWWQATVTGLVGDGADSVGFQALAVQTNTYGTFIDEVVLKEVAGVLTAAAGGDRIDLGADSDKDVAIYRQGDGFDVITNFLGQDTLQLDVTTDGNWALAQVMFEGKLSTLVHDTTDASGRSGIVLVDTVVTAFGASANGVGDVIFI